MISVSEALTIVKDNKIDLEIEEIDFLEAVGRVLAEDIHADRDFPPFNRVAMDGIGIQYQAFAQGKRAFPVESSQFAGSPQLELGIAENCLEVMTGAMLPKNVDTVIRYEDVTVENGVATVSVDTVVEGQNIHTQASDMPQEARLLSKGKLLRTTDVGTLSTVGKKRVKVYKLPRVAVISTGDELVDVDEQPQPYQIRKSNVYAILAELHELGISASIHHLKDDQDILLAEIPRILENHDALVFSGGVSKGKKDYLPQVLEDIGVEKSFHRIAQKPGKPMWFGSNEAGKVIFGFPGNPVSTFVCFKLYFLNWLNASLGVEPKELKAELTKDVTFKPDLDFHVVVKLHAEGTKLKATPIRSGGSGDLVALTNLDGFILLPRGKEVFSAGETYPVIKL